MIASPRFVRPSSSNVKRSMSNVDQKAPRLRPAHFLCPLCRLNEVLIGVTYEREGVILCDKCDGRATDAYHRPITFANQSMSGGFMALYMNGANDNGGERECKEVTGSQICFVDGVACYGNERRFGGTLLRLASDELVRRQKYIDQITDAHVRKEKLERFKAFQDTIRRAKQTYAANVPSCR